jgi:hypothetical protein
VYALTSDKEGARIKSMKRVAKSLVVFGLVLFFTSAVLCATLAAPAQSLASVTGCSQTDLPMKVADCEHPSYLCGFDRSSNLVSESALSSARPNDSLKNALSVAVGEACFDTAYSGPFIGSEHTIVFPVGPHKVPIYLYNSVLTL